MPVININNDDIRLNSSSSDKVVVNGNLGIGTTAPQAKLDISGGYIRLQELSNNANGWSVWSNAGFLSSRITTSGHSRGWGWEFTDNYPDSATPGVYFRVGYNGAVSYLTSGNFGIGTSSPVTKLDVVNQGNTAGGTMMLSGSKTNNQVKYGVITTAQYASDTETEGVGLIGGTNTSTENIVNIGGGVDEINTATSIRFFTAANTTTRGSANEQMRINSSGNVLIGTTTDSGYKLAVNGTITTANYSYLSTYGYGATQLRTYEISTGTSVSDNQVFNLYLGRFGNGYHRITLWGTGYGTDSGNYFDITRTWNGTPSIITNGGLIMGGAQYTIHWAAVSSGQYDLFIKWYAGMPTGYSNIINYAIQSNTGYQYVQFDYPGGVTVPTLDSSNLVASRMTIQYTSGNVGIGTTSPGYKLEVNGDIGFSGGASLKWGGNTYIYGNNNTQIEAVVNGNYGWFINSSGNVGIGNSNPGSLLQVGNAGAAPTGLATLTLTGANTAPQIATKPGLYHRHAVGLGVFSDYAMSFQVNGSSALSDAMYITNTGNVGIGTTSPFGKLNITRAGINEGAISFDDETSNAHLVLAGSDSLVRMQLGTYNNGSYGAWIQASYDNGGTSYGVEPLILNPQGGNVGIGTTSPVSALSVVGKTNLGGQASGFYVTPSTLHIASSTVSQISFEDYIITAAIAIANNTFAFGHQNASPSYEFKHSNTYNGNYATTGTTFARFNPTTSYISSGNVLIGTTTDAGYRVNLSGDINVSGAVRLAGGGATVTFISESWGINLNGSATQPTQVRGSSFSVGYVLGAGTNYGTGNMFVSGIVGIGELNPTQLLHLTGTNAANNGITIQNTNASGNSQVRFLNASGVERAAITYINAADAIYMYTSAGGNLLNLVGGNVLIGTTTDNGAKLNVNGTSYINGAASFGSTINVNGNVTLTQDTNDLIFQQTNSSSHGIVWKNTSYTKDSASIRPTGNGAWATQGIGFYTGNAGDSTTAPTIRFNIEAGGNITMFGVNNHLKFDNWSDDNNYIQQTKPDGTVVGYMGFDGYSTPSAYYTDYVVFTRPSGGSLTRRIFVSQTGAMSLQDATGNVIIGSATDAGYKLDVHGEILGRDDIRILNTYALVLNGTDNNWRIGRNTISDSGWLTSNTMQMVVFGSSSGQGFQVVNHNGTALFEIDGVAGASRFTNALGVGVNPSGTAGRIDASNDIVAYSTSDQRLKENITPIANALDKVKALTGVEFDWKEETKDVHGYEGHDVGVIAQEVQAVLPEAVRTNDSGYLSVRYEKMIALLVEANKELASRVEELEKKLK